MRYFSTVIVVKIINIIIIDNKCIDISLLICLVCYLKINEIMMRSYVMMIIIIYIAITLIQSSLKIASASASALLTVGSDDALDKRPRRAKRLALMWTIERSPG